MHSIKNVDVNDVTRGDALVEQTSDENSEAGSILFRFEDMPVVKIKFPETINSSAMLAIHAAKTNEYVGMNGFYTMLIIVPQIVLLAIDVVTQISFVQYLQKTLSGLDSCEIRTDLVLRYLSVAAFLAGMIFDFFECFEMVLCCGHGTWKRKMIIKHFSSKSEQTGAKN